jgi:hypothetical protein
MRREFCLEVDTFSFVPVCQKVGQARNHMSWLQQISFPTTIAFRSQYSSPWEVLVVRRILHEPRSPRNPQLRPWIRLCQILRHSYFSPYAVTNFGENIMLANDTQVA